MAKHIAIVCPSSVDKSALLRALTNIVPEFSIPVRFTTRNKKDGEIAGKDFHFFKKEQFEERLESKEILEFNKSKEDFYGTLFTEINHIKSSGRSILSCVDINGAMALKEFLGNNIMVCFLDDLIQISEEVKDSLMRSCDRVFLCKRDVNLLANDIANERKSFFQRETFTLVDKN